MGLDLEFHKADALTNATAYVVVTDERPSPDGLPCLTVDCVSMAELETELRRLEMEISKIRVAAKQSFLAVSVSG
jgi:hypothetical protein